MELGQQGSSETSSEENGRKEQVKLDDTSTTTNNTSTTTTTKRFYECTFCKKGFDNAQALGGHMNIHRGAKAKAKQVATSSPPIRSNEEYFKPTYMAPISSEPPRVSFYPVPEARSNYHNMYFQSSGSCPRQPYAHNYQFGTDFLLPRPRSLSINNEELCGSNLSLQIGSDQAQENEITMGVAKEDEVDLELRLGHHDRY